jgi:transcription termination factor Rho
MTLADELEIENASTLRTQDLLFAILKKLAEKDETITSEGVLEILQDGFGFLRSPNRITYQVLMIYMYLLHKSENLH